jgi:hypothetical protein
VKILMRDGAHDPTIFKSSIFRLQRMHVGMKSLMLTHEIGEIKSVSGNRQARVMPFWKQGMRRLQPHFLRPSPPRSESPNAPLLTRWCLSMYGTGSDDAIHRYSSMTHRNALSGRICSSARPCVPPTDEDDIAWLSGDQALARNSANEFLKSRPSCRRIRNMPCRSVSMHDVIKDRAFI